MKRPGFIACGAILLACTTWTPLANAASNAEKLAAIQQGLAHLYATQQPGGSWTGSASERAATGAAVFAILSQRDKWGSNTAQYEAGASRAIAYLLNTPNKIEVTGEGPNGRFCPGASASCPGVFWDGNGESTYATALAVQAIVEYALVAGPYEVATSSGPLAGMTWTQIAQAAINAVAAAQISGGAVENEGAWGRFMPASTESDMTSTLWALTTLLYAGELGAETPPHVKERLLKWLNTAQNTSGAGCDRPGSERCDHAGTGIWLLAMSFAGADAASPRQQSAIAFLNANWTAAVNSGNSGNFGQPVAMWAVHNALQASLGPSDTTHISNLLTDCGVSRSQTNRESDGRCTWSEDYTEWLVRNQRADGSWEGYSVWTDPVSTALSIAIIGGSHVPIGPYRCPMARSFWASSPNEWPRALVILGGRLYSKDDLAAILNGAIPSGIPSGAKSDLISELITAKLNLVLGSDPAPATGAIARADEFLRIPGAKQIGDEARVLHAYNSGALTSGCGSTDSGASGTSAETTASTAQTPSHPGTTMSAVVNSSTARLTQLAGAKNRSRTRKGVTALGISSDGSSLATGSTDNNVRVWSAGTGAQSVVLAGTLGLPTGLSFSPGGSTLATVSRDSVVRLWDPVHGTHNADLTGHEQAVTALAVSPDGRSLATAGEDTRVMLWDISAHKLSKIIWGPQSFVNSISFHPNGQTLASAGDDARVLIADVTTGKTLFTLLGHSGPINTLSFSPDGTILASGGQDTVIHLWDPAKGQQRQTLNGHTAPIRSLAFSPDGQLLASGGEDAQILLWNVATGAISARLASSATINVLGFDPKGKFLAVANESGQVTLWNVKTGALLRTITVP